MKHLQAICVPKLLGNTIDTQFDRIVLLTEQGVTEAFEQAFERMAFEVKAFSGKTAFSSKMRAQLQYSVPLKPYRAFWQPREASSGAQGAVRPRYRGKSAAAKNDHSLHKSVETMTAALEIPFLPPRHMGKARVTGTCLDCRR